MVKEEKELKPKIPVDILKEFVTRNISEKDKNTDYKVKCHFLWEHNDVERYRINVWISKSVAGQFCDRNCIAYSWFTHFHKRTKTLVDKTIIEEKKDGKKYRY